MKFGRAPTTRIHLLVNEVIIVSHRAHRDHSDYIKEKNISHRVHRDHSDYVKEKNISHRVHRDHRGKTRNQSYKKKTLCPLWALCEMSSNPESVF
jgi:hypothetical protein